MGYLKQSTPFLCLRPKGYCRRAAPRVRAEPDRRELYDPLDLGTQADQVLDEQRIAPVDVEHVVDLGVAVGDQTGQHQAGAGPDIRGPHRRTGQLTEGP